MSKYTHIEWLNRNSLRSYPVRENQNLVASNGFELPNDLLVDIRMSTPYETDSIGILSVFVTNKVISINFCNQSIDPVATAVFQVGEQYVYENVKLNTILDGYAGNATCGPAVYSESGVSLMPGHHIFSTPCWLEKSTCLGLWSFPVTSIRASGFPVLQGNPQLSFSGDISSTVSQGVDSEGRPSNFILLELNNQVNYLSECQQVQNAFECGQVPIMSVNGVTPDQNGSIQLNFVGFDSVSGSGSTVLVSKVSTAAQLCAPTQKPAMPDQYGYLPGTAPDFSAKTSSWNVGLENLSAPVSPIIVSTQYVTNPFSCGAILTISGSIDDDIAINGFVYESGFFPYMNGVCGGGDCAQASSWTKTADRLSNSVHSLGDPCVIEVGAAESTRIDLLNNWGTGANANLSIAYAPIVPHGSSIAQPPPIGYSEITKHFRVNVSDLVQGNPQLNFNYQFPNMQLLGAAYPLTHQTYELSSGATGRIWQRRTYQNPFKSYAALVKVTGYADGGVGINGNIVAYMQGETYQSVSVDPSQSYTFGVSKGDTFTVDWIAYEGQPNVNRLDLTITITRVEFGGVAGPGPVAMP